MRKQEFLDALEARLLGLPKKEIEERLDFYGEMIDDRVEEGLSDEEAVAAIGTVDDIVFDIIEDIPLSKLIKEKIKPKKRLKAWELTLLWLGSPVWLSLAVSAFAVFLALYVSVWAVVSCFWAAFASLAGSSLGGIISGVFFAISGNVLSGIAVIGGGILCAGLAIFLFFGSLTATKSVATFTKRMVLKVKRRFLKKEGAQ